MEIWGKAISAVGNQVIVSAESLEEVNNLAELITAGDVEVVLQIADGRQISSVQRRKAYAIIRDFADFTGYDREDMKSILKFAFEADSGHEYFSFATVDVTTAREFITFILGIALAWHIPLRQPAMEYQDDLKAFMYQSLRYRSCVICGQHADVHHIDAVGMGNDRKLVDHRGRRLIALCREHHQLAHNMGWKTFSETYHVVGVTLDEQTLHDLGIMTFKRMKELDDE
jgi:hypothetical protein